jgi:hypothetical protein
LSGPGVARRAVADRLHQEADRHAIEDGDPTIHRQRTGPRTDGASTFERPIGHLDIRRRVPDMDQHADIAGQEDVGDHWDGPDRRPGDHEGKREGCGHGDHQGDQDTPAALEGLAATRNDRVKQAGS